MITLMLGGFVISKEMLGQYMSRLYPLIVNEDFFSRYPTADGFICSTEFESICLFLGKAMNLINAAEIYIARYELISAQKCFERAKKIEVANIELLDCGGLDSTSRDIVRNIISPQLASLKQKLDALLETLQPTTLVRHCFLALLKHGITAEGKKNLSHVFTDDTEYKGIIDKMPAARLDAVGAPAPSASVALPPPPPSSAAPHVPAPYYPAPQPPEPSEDHVSQLGSKP